MACSNCNTPNCGCSGTYVVSQTCPPACSEVFNSACIVYTGVDITCTNPLTGLSSTVVSRNDYLDTALTSIVNFFCARVNEALTSTVVVSANEYIAVTSAVVGSVTTYTVALDIDAVAAAVDGNTTVVEAGGTNVTVDETVVGSVTTYTVTAQGTDVQSGDDFIDVAVTQVGDDDIVTITLDINEVQDELGTVSVAEGPTGHVIVTEVPDFPTAGDTQYRLDSISTDIQSVEEVPSEGPLITVTPSGGTAPDYDQLFTLQMDVDNLREFIMDTTSGVAPVGGIVGDALSGIDVTYDPVSHTLTIINTAGLPNRWLTLGNNGVDPDISASSPTDILNITGTTGISVSLASAGPNDGTFTIVNTDLGSDQLIFGSCQASNGGVITDPACQAGSNTDTLTLDGGDDITLTAVGNTITINNDIDAVYGTVIGNDLVNLLAPTSSASLSIVGGSNITTSGAAGPINELTIDWTGIVTAGAGLTGTGTAADPLVNAANVYSTIDGDAGSTTATGLADTLTIAGGTGITTDASVADTVTINSTDALVVVRDMTIFGGAVTIPNDNATAGECDVTTAGINSTFVQVQIVDTAGRIQNNAVVDGIGVSGAGIFSVLNSGGVLADGDYKIIVTGNRV
jgi:hypothetical protein